MSDPDKMADRYDPLPDLAELLVAGLWERHDVVSIADRITGRLGIGEDDSPDVVTEILRQALDPEGEDGCE